MEIGFCSRVELLKIRKQVNCIYMTQIYSFYSRFRILLMVAIIFLIQGENLFAQVGTPTYFNATGTSANAFPYSSTTSNKIQYIYAPNVFSTLGGGAGTAAPGGYNITKIYIKFSATVSATASYTNFTLSLGQTLGSINNFPQAPATTGVSFYTGLTQVFYQASGFQFTGITANAWYGITLQTPFLYDPTKALLCEMKVSAGTGNSVATVTTSGISQRIYGGYASATGTANTLLTPFGFDMVPAVGCTAPPTGGTSTASPSSGLCIGSAIQLDLSGNSVGSGQTYQWQYGPTSSGPWTYIGTPSVSSALNTNASTTQYYQCELICSGQTSYSTPVLVTVNPAAPGGTYTINSAQPTAGTNFQSFNAMLAYFACGISGPVVVNVVAGSGPYNEQVIAGPIPGASAINTFTINGNGEKISFSSANSASPSTVELNGTDYLIVNNLKFEALGATYAFACHLWNNADNNTFNGCTFSSPINGSSTTQVPFSISGSQTSATTSGAAGVNNIITNSTIEGGYYCTAIVGNTAPLATGNQLTDNIIRDYYIYGTYLLYQNGLIVRNNNYSRPNRTTYSTFYGLYVSTGCVAVQITKNRIHDPFATATTNTGTAYGIYILVDGAVGTENVVVNNLIYNMKSNGVVGGIYLSGADYVKCYHNTISINDATPTTTSATYGIYNSGTVGGVDIKNNIVSIVRGGTGSKYDLYYVTPSVVTSDNNVLHMNSSGTTNYIGYNGTTNYATLALWQAGVSKDLASVSTDPFFNNISLADYMPTSSGVNNMGANVGVTDDINGAVRNIAIPDPGCYEFSLAATDLTFQSVSNPVSTVSCYSYNEVVNAVIKNSGTDPLDFSLNPATITAIINGPVSYVVSENVSSGTLAVNQTMSIPLNPSIDLSIDGSYSVSGSVSMVGDGNSTNDNLINFNFNVGVIPGTIASNQPSPICLNSTPTFTLTGQSGGTRQWQMSTVSASGPWNNVGTGGTTYAPGTQSADYWIRVESNCNTNYAYTNVISMVVTNPQLTGTTPGSRCGTGSVALSASVTMGTANWYANATGGSPLYTGLTYNTPSIASTTTYYVSATDGGINASLGLPNRVGATTNSGYSDIGLMFDALQSFTLTSVAIYPVATTPSGNVTATIALKNSAGTILQSTTVAVATSVSPGIKTVVPLNFTVPAGTGHRLVFTAASGGGITGFIRESATGYTYPYTLPGVASITSAYTSGASSSFYYYFYDWQISSGCEGSRVPVVATVNPAPVINVSASTNAPCPGSNVDLTVSSSNDPNYTYTWSSVPSGFTGSGPGPLSILPTATTTYSVFAEDLSAGPNAGCTAYGSVVVNAAATLSGGTISAPITSLCNGQQASFTLTGASGGIHQWQYSTVSSSGPWTNTGTGATSYTSGPLSQTTYFRVDEQCQTADAPSNVLTINVNNPSLSSTTGDTRCGPGLVNLNAVPANVGDVVNWYNVPTGGTPLYTGNTYSPTVAATSTYYAAASTGAGGGATSAAVPLANGTTTGVYHHMFMVTSPTGLTLQSMGLKVNDAVNTLGSWNIYYRPDNYQLVAGANTSSTGWILLSSTTNVPSLGNTTYTTISSPFSLVIPQGATYSFYIQPVTGTHQYAASAIGTQLVANANVTFVAGNRGSANFNCTTSGGQAVVSLGYSLGCEGTRVPVVATVNAAPSINVAAVSTTLCPNESTDISVTSSNDPNYTYAWTSTPAGFTGSGNGPFTVTPNAVVTYSVTATDNTSGPYAGCVTTGTVTVNSAAVLSGGTISANLSEHCYSGVSILTCAGSSGGPIQWEESTVSSSGPWTNVGTLGSNTFTTATLTQTAYYRTSVSCGTNTNYSGVQTITVNNPSVLTTVPGETCGAGSATLSGTASAGATLKWYDVPTGGTSLATGNSFNTPVISSTTTYYVSATTGAGLVSTGKTSANTTATSGAGTTNFGLVFDALSAFTLQSVKVYPVSATSASGTVTIDVINSSGTVLNTATFSVTGAPVGSIPGTTLTLNFNIAPGTNLKLRPGSFTGITGLLFEPAASAPGGNYGYPYVVPGVVSINHSTLTAAPTNTPRLDLYYYFYDWKIAAGCESARTPVIATVGPVVSMSGLGASYSTTASSVTLTGSPAGGTFSGPGVSGNTFSPSLAGAGTHTVTYSVPGSTCTASQTVIVTPPPTSTLNLKCYIEGFYIGGGMMQSVLSNQGLTNPVTDCDDVVIELHDGTSPYATAYTFSGVLQTDGTLSCTFPGATQGNSYYIVVNHRNAMQTWSANPVLISAVTTYDFSTASNQAYGDNQVQVATGVWAFYSGDVNQDLSIDAFDYLLMDPDIYNGAGGWLATDLNGDGSVDAFDYLIYDPNGYNGITVQSP